MEKLIENCFKGVTIGLLLGGLFLTVKLGKLSSEVDNLKKNKVTLICDNYVYKQNLNQALAKNCYVISKEGKNDN